MKSFLSLTLATIFFFASCTTQQVQHGLGILGGVGLSSNEAAGGLKEALSKGLITGIGILSKEDGFLGNQLVRIPWPEEAQFVMEAMSKIGMQRQVDNVTLSLNRAAERASKEALDVFIETVKQMTIQDAMGILVGGDGAATNYLRRTTTPILTERFRPIVDVSLQAVNATRLWNDVVSTYNKIPLVNRKVETDLTAYVTSRALQGVYVMVEQEENKIRNNINERTTPLLQKAFGYADSQKK
jgi:hypothetical protein